MEIEREITDIIKQVGRYTVASMRNDLAKYDLKDSNLYKNVKFIPAKTRLTIELPNYAVFVDEGVEGAIEKKFKSRFSFKSKYPPFVAIYDWVKRYRRKIGRGRDASGKFISDNRLAFMIQRAIYRRGLKPRPFIDNNLEAGFTLLAELINDPKKSDKLFAQVRYNRKKTKI